MEGAVLSRRATDGHNHQARDNQDEDASYLTKQPLANALRWSDVPMCSASSSQIFAARSDRASCGQLPGAELVGQKE